MANNELYHYGVLGMKWGVRKSRGGRVSKTGRRGRIIKERPPAHEDYKKAHSKKSVREMSDAELRSRINRLQMEKQYKELSNVSINKGKKFASRVLKDVKTANDVINTGFSTYSNVTRIRKLING